MTEREVVEMIKVLQQENRNLAEERKLLIDACEKAQGFVRELIVQVEYYKKAALELNKKLEALNGTPGDIPDTTIKAELEHAEYCREIKESAPPTTANLHRGRSMSDFGNILEEARPEPITMDDQSIACIQELQALMGRPASEIVNIAIKSLHYTLNRKLKEKMLAMVKSPSQYNN